uniref:Uncharacterized protein n=1 Tax=Tetranychus urticae TaxID=32264 RepID=T1KU22_TETUR
MQIRTLTAADQIPEETHVDNAMSILSIIIIWLISLINKDNGYPIKSSLIPGIKLGKLLRRIAIGDLKWTQVAILHSIDEHSLQTLKLLGQASLKDNFCLTMVSGLPNPNLFETHDDPRTSSTKDESLSYLGIIKTMVSSIPENVPILIIANEPSVKHLFTNLAVNLEIISRHLFLFISLLSC